MLGLRYLVTGVPVEEIDRSYQPGDFTTIGRIGKAYVYENPGALPRSTGRDLRHAGGFRGHDRERRMAGG